MILPRSHRAVLFIISVSMTIGLWFAVIPSSPADSDGVRPVIPRTRIAALGRVEPRSEEISIAAAMTGRIATVIVTEGEQVTAGQIVATLEQADHAARLQQAQAALAGARAKLDRVINGARQVERELALAAVRESEAVLALARLELERQQGLERRKLGSRQELDRARSEAQVATARLSQTRLQYELINSAARADEQAVAEAEVQLAAARVQEMQAIVNKCAVRSPIAGVVLRQLRHPGEQVTELGDTPIMIIGDTTVLHVRAEVDEGDIALVRPNQMVTIQADGLGEQQFSGRVIRLSKQMGRKALRNDKPDEQVDTRVLEVLIELAPQSALPVGLRVDVFFALDQS